MPRCRDLAVLLAVAGGLAGCTLGGSRSASAENDRLRKAMVEKDARIAALEGDKAELIVKLAGGERRGLHLPPDAAATLPVATGVDVGRFSGLLPASAKGAATGCRVEFSPRDGRGRFVPVAGSVKARVLLDGAEPRLLGEVALDAAAVREAYRSGLTGTYYECEVPLAAPLERPGEADPAVVVRLELTDAMTGEVLKAERTIAPPARAAK